MNPVYHARRPLTHRERGYVIALRKRLSYMEARQERGDASHFLAHEASAIRWALENLDDTDETRRLSSMIDEALR